MELIAGKMKKILLLFIFGLVVACDPEECGSMIIENQSGKDLSLSFFWADSVSQKFDVAHQQTYTFLDKACSMGGPKFISLSSYDSVKVFSKLDNSLLRTYVHQDQDKNILDFSDWTRTVEGGDMHIATFTITEEDINNSHSKD